MKLFHSGNSGIVGRAPEVMVPGVCVMLSFFDFSVERRSCSVQRLRALLARPPKPPKKK